MDSNFRLTDIVPREYFQAPIKEKTYYDSVQRFALLALPIVIGFAVTFSVGIAILLSPLWFVGVGAILCGLGISYIGWIVRGAYFKTSKSFDVQVANNTVVTNRVAAMIQSMTVNQIIEVRKGGTLNNNPTQTPSALEQGALDTVEDSINETYSLALSIWRVAIDSWTIASGKRPKPKPFSAEVITAKFHVGREKWMEAIQFIDDSKLIDKPDSAVWTPLVESFEAGKTLLDARMQELGYFRNRTRRGKEIWMK